jgi:2-dehydropantoate 2-reductase
MTALTLCDDANLIRSSSYALDMLKSVMGEVGAIAGAVGYPRAVTEHSIADHVQRHASRLESGGKEPSMLVDIHNNRQIEVEAILGNTVRKAEEFRVDVPYLKMLYVLAKARNFATMKNDEWKPIATVS